MRYLMVLVVLLGLLNNGAMAKERPEFAFPPGYNLTLDQALKLVKGHLVVELLGIDSKYDGEGTGRGRTGQGTLDSILGTKVARVYIPGPLGSTSLPAKMTLKWYSSLTRQSGEGEQFSFKSKLGVNHIYVRLICNGWPSMTGNYYLNTVMPVHVYTKHVVGEKGPVEQMMKTFCQGTEAQAIFQLTDSRELKEKVGTEVNGALVKVNAGVETAHARAKTEAIRVNVKDDGRSLMFPSRQKVIVVTIVETVRIDRAGHITTTVRKEKSEVQNLTITKIRPGKGGTYSWED